MSRLPYLRRDDLDPDGQRLWDSIVVSRGTELPQDFLVNDEGGLRGPFNALMHAQGAGRRIGTLGRVLRFETSIERRLSEVAIITVGARWKAEFEWWAHARMAREHGVPAAVVDAIAEGEDPPFESDDERIVYSVARQLAETGRVRQDAYDAARQLLGDTGLVELVSLCGYYTLISFLLNAFEVPLPPGAAPLWNATPPEHSNVSPSEPR
ncbi:MAG: carboxymuconolactone decarboxylase family protein [Streptosporangiaceae bacterium]